MNFSLKKLEEFSHKNLLIWVESDKERHFKYREMLQESKRILSLLQKHAERDAKIGLQLAGPQLLTIILSIMNKPGCFCPIDVNKDLRELLEQAKLSHFETFFAEEDYSISGNEIKLCEKIQLFGKEIFLLKYDSKNSREIDFNLFLYSIQTSGSTGESKIVNVPEKCISPNILSLSKIYGITELDIFLVSTPSTFDPFIVDLFLALNSGACLLMCSKTVLLNSKLFTLCCCRTATVLQITPSNFLRLKDGINEEIFTEGSTLRILTLGGEPFPSKEIISLWKNWELPQPKRVFNIYGTTEVSCWATCEEVIFENQNIGIGKPIDSETILQIQEDGELYIGSRSRKCVLSTENPEEILEKEKLIFRHTGDFVEMNSDGNYFYKGRLNDVVKRFGEKINLKIIEAKLEQLQEILQAVCVFSQAENFLTAFVILKKNFSGNLSNILWKIRNLNGNELPNDFIELDNFPLSNHGKICKKQLLELYHAKKVSETKNLDVKHIFKEKLMEYLKIKPKLKRLKRDNDFTESDFWKKTFKSAGGSSFIALMLINDIERLVNSSFENILMKLLDESYTLEAIVDSVENVTLNRSCEGLNDVYNSHILSIEWKFDLGKCVDSSPTIYKVNSRNVVSVGSHSHLLANLDASTGKEISKLKLPDRIEGKVAVFRDEFALVGCYDGKLYKFNILCGSIIWSYDSGGMIKCEPIISNSLVVFGSYSLEKNLHCLNCENHTNKWSTKIGSKGIFSSPVLHENNKIIVCTLDGLMAVIDLSSGEIVEEVKFVSPIFSTPSIISDGAIIVAEVSGIFHCLDRNLNERWRYKASGTIFSSFEIQQTGTNVLIIFGCHDMHLYCLSTSIKNPTEVTLVWRIRTDSQIYSTPKAINRKGKSLLVLCTTQGSISIVDTQTGGQVSLFRLSGEIFSTPCISDDKIYVGCRDNYIYCIKIS